MRDFARVSGIFFFLIFSPGYTKAQGFSAEVKFYINYAGATVEGKFYGFRGEFNFDPKDPGNSTLRASVDASTIETGIKLRDNHLRSGSFFDVENYPRIEMISREIIRLDDGTFSGEFDLYLKGITKRVKVPFTYTPEGNYNRFVGSFRIDRLDFGVGNRGLLMDSEVKISIDVSARDSEP